MTKVMKLYSGVRRPAALIAAAAFAGAMLAGGSAQAQVKPGDTFTFDVAGFNSTSGVGYVLGPDESAVFGTTQTYVGAGYNGQNITITSSEVVGATMTTDTFTVSTPTNFLTSTTVNGTKITALQFDLGDANSGVSFGNVPDTVDLLSAVSSTTSTGNILYGAANTSFTLTPTVTLSNGGLSYAAVEGVNDGTTAISTLAIHSFTLAVTYANAAVSAAPEPSTWALMFFGVGAIGVSLRRAKKKQTFAGAIAA